MSYFDDNEARITGLPRYLTDPRMIAGMSNGFRKLTGLNKTMQITILNIAKVQKTGPSGKPYDVLDIAYKNDTFQGKVEGKNLMPFGANAGGFNVLKNATTGQTYEITVVKNDKGYNDWTNATQVEAGAAPSPAQAPQRSSNAAAPAPSAARVNTFETPEERAKKQVYIIRQSSLSAAIGTLSPGAKSALKPADVIAAAKEYEAYVLDLNTEPQAADEELGTDDIPY